MIANIRHGRQCQILTQLRFLAKVYSRRQTPTMRIAFYGRNVVPPLQDRSRDEEINLLRASDVESRMQTVKLPLSAEM